MKKIISIFVILLMLFLHQVVMAAGTVTQTYVKVTNNVSCLTYSWTAISIIPIKESLKLMGFEFVK